MTAVEGDSGTYVSVQSDDFTVSTNSETADEIKANLAPEPEKKDGEDISKAAAALGAKGGKAAAEARKAKADDSEGEAEGDEKPAEEEKLGKPRDDPKARMLEATRQAAEVKRLLAAERQERERLAAEIRQLREASAPKAEAAPTPPPDADPKPKPEDFSEYEEFLDARARWSARQEYQAQAGRAEAEARAAEWARAVVHTVDTFNERLSKAEPGLLDKVHPKLLEALTPSFQLEPGQQPTQVHFIADEVLTSEQAPALLVHFTEHPDDFQRIASLRTPREISREMAKLEARFDAVTAGTSPKPSYSKAPPPVRPVTGTPSTAESEVDDDLPFEEHFRRMNARDFKAKRGSLTR